MAGFAELTVHAPCGSRQPRRYRVWLERRANRVRPTQTTPMRLETMVSRTAPPIQTRRRIRTTHGPFRAKFRQELVSGDRVLRVNREPTANEEVESLGGAWRRTADNEDS